MALDPARMNNSPSSKSGEMVTIGCKAPKGLILNLDHYERVNDKDVVRRIDGPTRVVLKGWSVPFGTQANLSGGYAMTQVPREFWEEWVKQHSDFPMLKDKTLIGPHADPIGQARDYAKVERMFRPARIGDVPKVAGTPALEMAPESARPMETEAA